MKRLKYDPSFISFEMKIYYLLGLILSFKGYEKEYLSTMFIYQRVSQHLKTTNI